MTRNKYGTGSVRQTGPQRWQIRWSDGVDPFTGDHVRRSETIHGSKTDANRALAARTAARGRMSRVTLGTLMLAVMLVRILRGHFDAEHQFGFEAASWYWHFVDVVWIALFVFVYVL